MLDHCIIQEESSSSTYKQNISGNTMLGAKDLEDMPVIGIRSKTRFLYIADESNVIFLHLREAWAAQSSLGNPFEESTIDGNMLRLHADFMYEVLDNG